MTFFSTFGCGKQSTFLRVGFPAILARDVSSKIIKLEALFFQDFACLFSPQPPAKTSTTSIKINFICEPIDLIDFFYCFSCPSLLVEGDELVF